LFNQRTKPTLNPFRSFVNRLVENFLSPIFVSLISLSLKTYETFFYYFWRLLPESFPSHGPDCSVVSFGERFFVDNCHEQPGTAKLLNLAFLWLLLL
jgi:hypothetical protein